MVFSGRSNISLAREVAGLLGTKLGDVEISRFSNDEARVWVSEQKVNHSAIVVQSLSQPVDSHIIEFGLLCDGLYRMGVQDLVAVVPWLAYSKQDKVFREGEPLSVKVIAKMLQVVPVRRLFTFDLHNLAILGFFDIPVVNLSARPVMIDYFKSKATSNSVVVAPDAGAIKSSHAFAQALDVPIVYMDKKRNLETGKVTVMGMSREIKGQDVFILDDMIVTGSTLIETSKYLKNHGAKTISVAATHHLYVPGAQEAIENGGVDEVVVTNTIEAKTASPKLKILSVAPVIAQALKSRD